MRCWGRCNEPGSRGVTYLRTANRARLSEGIYYCQDRGGSLTCAQRTGLACQRVYIIVKTEGGQLPAHPSQRNLWRCVCIKRDLVGNKWVTSGSQVGYMCEEEGVLERVCRGGGCWRACV